MDRIIVGIDGGRTHTTLAAVAPDGTVLGFRQAGALNYHTIGMDAFRRNLAEGLALVERDFGPIGLMGLGHSALDDAPSPALLSEMLQGVFPVGNAAVQSDVFVTLVGASLGAPGVAVVAGTGAMAAALDASGKTHVLGGWGYLLGDTGSGYDLGQKGLTAAVNALDGIAPPTCLSGQVAEFFSVDTPRAAIEPLYDPSFGPAGIAGFAPRVLAGAEAGDAVCRSIVDGALDALSGYAANLMASIGEEACTVAVFGGLFEHSEPFFRGFEAQLSARCPKARVTLPKLPPCLGAAVYAVSQKGHLTPAFAEKLAEGIQKE